MGSETSTIASITATTWSAVKQIFDFLIHLASKVSLSLLWVIVAIVVQAAWNPLQTVDAGWARSSAQDQLDNQAQLLANQYDLAANEAERDQLLAELTSALAAPQTSQQGVDVNAQPSAATVYRTPDEIRNDLALNAQQTLNRDSIRHSTPPPSSQRRNSRSATGTTMALVIAVIFASLSKYCIDRKNNQALSLKDPRTLFGIILPLVIAVPAGLWTIPRWVQSPEAAPRSWPQTSETENAESQTFDSALDEWIKNGTSAPVKLVTVKNFHIDLQPVGKSEPGQTVIGSSEDSPGLTSDTLNPWLTSVEGHTRHVAVASQHVVLVYDYENEEYLCRVDSPSKISGLEISPDGTKFAIATADGRMILYNIQKKATSTCEVDTQVRVGEGAAVDVLFTDNSTAYLLSADANTGTTVMSEIKLGREAFINRQLALKMESGKHLQLLDGYVLVAPGEAVRDDDPSTEGESSSDVDPSTSDQESESWKMANVEGTAALVSVSGRSLDARYFASLYSHGVGSLIGKLGFVSVDDVACNVVLLTITESGVETRSIPCGAGGNEVASVGEAGFVVTSDGSVSPELVSTVQLTSDSTQTVHRVSTTAAGSLDFDQDTRVLALSGSSGIEILEAR